MLNTQPRRPSGFLTRPGLPGAGGLSATLLSLWALATSGLAQAQQVAQTTVIPQVTQAQQRVTVGDLNSSYNREIWWMSIGVIIVAILIFIGVSAALFYTVRRFREDKHEAPAAQFHGNNKLEVWLVTVPIIIVTIITVLAVRTMARTSPVPPNVLKVNVKGAQFWWAFSYPAAPANGGGSVTNGNELVVPVGTKVSLTATADDVIHAFWAPNLGGQRDSIPGVKKTWQVDTDREGVYQGNCGVLCGASHANMRFKVIALPKAQFETFIKAAQAYQAPKPNTPQTTRGYQIFMQGKVASGAVPCASCHRIQGTPAAGVSGPDLSYFGSRNTLGANMWEGDQARKMLHDWLKHSNVVKPGSLMPAFDGQLHTVKGKTQRAGLLTDAELDDVAAYLRTLQLPADAAYWGKVPVR
jgi:cytochrome c oxidase subunit II